MDPSTRALVWDRAHHRCEYCLIHQDNEPFYRLHVEHVIAKQHGGGDDPDNLALACHHDNEHKGPNLSGVGPKTGKVVRLFNPRRHFRFVGPMIIGRTPSGRATVAVLALNARDRVNLRAELIADGMFPPGGALLRPS